MYGLPKLPSTTIVTVAHFQRIIGYVASKTGSKGTAIRNRKNLSRQITWGEFKRAICCMATQDNPIHIPDKASNQMVTIGDVAKHLCCLNDGATVVAGPSQTINKTSTVVNNNDGTFNITYNIVVCNNGNVDLNNVVITDTIPADINVLSVVPSTGTVVSSTNNIEVSIPLLAKGTCVTVIVETLVTTAYSSNSVTNAALTTSDETDIIDSTVTDELPDTVDLYIVKTVNNSTPTPGTTVIFTLTFGNNGPDTEDNVVITDILPTGLTYISDDKSNALSTGTWNYGTMASGDSDVINITALVTASFTGPITNSASISGDEQDIDTKNNDEDEIITPPSSDLLITKSTTKSNYKVGELVCFDLNVQNKGTEDSPNTIITDLLPSNFTFVSLHLDPAGANTDITSSYNITDGTYNHGTLIANTAIDLRICGTAITAGTNIVNTATVSGDNSDPDTSNNTDTETVDISELSSDLYIIKEEILPPESRISATDPDPNTGVSQITVTNTGCDGNTTIVCGEPATIVVEIRDAGTNNVWTKLEEITGNTGSAVSTYTTDGGTNSILPHIPSTDIIFDCAGGTTFQFDKKAWANATPYNNSNIQDIRITTYVGGNTCPESINTDNTTEICAVLHVVFDNHILNSLEASDNGTITTYSDWTSSAFYGGPIGGIVEISNTLKLSLPNQCGGDAVSAVTGSNSIDFIITEITIGTNPPNSVYIPASTIGVTGYSNPPTILAGVISSGLTGANNYYTTDIGITHCTHRYGLYNVLSGCDLQDIRFIKLEKSDGAGGTTGEYVIFSVYPASALNF